MRSLGIFIFVSVFSLPLFSQSWIQVDDKSIPLLGKRNINPDKFITANVNDTEIKDILWSAPDELKFNPNTDKPTLINVMMADGTMDEFSIVRYQMMEPGLASRYDNIRTFHGLSTSNSVRRIRINYTVHGLRATITDENGQTYIDHLQRKDKNHKIIYKRNDFSSNEDWTCGFEGEKADIKEDRSSDSRSGDCVFRSYRFSMTATGEYSNYHGAFSAADSDLVLSAIVTTVDRVNDVYEQDITMRLILIDNTDDIFYYNPATDPFSTTVNSTLLNQNQSNTDAVIGSGNYDLGHIVTTGDGGIAQLGVPCSGSKARGATGRNVPEGDPFDIDYVAHEIGHQLGGNHTQNNSCQRNESTAMEPGSASTIMGYAGICNPNVQNNSDAYFHAISVQEMNATMASVSCHEVIALSNVAPVVNALTNKSIPHSTPFVLDAIATDGDGDALTYNWEQMDNEVGPTMPPAGTNAQGPMFRSKFATLDSKRYFPNIAAVAAGTNDTWEVLPTVNRNMDFRVTVRDNNFAPGCTDEQDITIDVEGNAGPFLVTSQNTVTTWLESETVTITWDVANTDASPVSCNDVDILLSYDSGLTYNTTMISGTPNDGSAQVVVPLGVTTTARVMVKCSDNVFFDINDIDIIIDSGSPSFLINSNPSSGSICDNLTIAFDIESTSILGYTNPITLTVSDLPPGATANVSSNPIVPGNNSTITLDNLDGLSGMFTVKVTGVSGAITRETLFDLTVENSPVVTVLSDPADGTTDAITEPMLTWNSTPGATSYEYQVSTIANGGNIVSSGNTASTSIVVSPELSLGTTYYWRVRSTNICGVTPWSDEWTFETGVCFIKTANDLPISISSSGTPTITSSLSFLDKGIITDLNVVDLIGNHTYIADLNFTLTSPDNTSLAFWSDPCNGQNNFDINFDDEAANNNWPCPPTNGLTYQPDNSLTAFDNKQMQGEWELEVFDDFNQDGGQLNSWGIEICLDDFCDLTVNNSAFVNTYGTLMSALGCAVDGDTIYIESSIANSSINIGSGSIVIDESIVIIANPNDNINISSEGSVPTFIINASKTVSLIGFEIENTDSSVGVIENFGNLILNDINIISDSNSTSIINRNNANLKIEGDCRLEE